ncbi:MAG: hypothetical protein KBA31_12625 [Alphaproteobacteria bacterium]|nr:hypothetical protein [Alphaproteobacteria bacterium]
MNKYLFAFHGGHRFKSPEEAGAYMKKWRQWSDGLGSTKVNPGMPVGPSKTVSSNNVADDGGANPISGFMLIQASDMTAAIAVAKPCPHLQIGGTIEVAEAMNMEM